jgi:hypothetical protein
MFPKTLKELQDLIVRIWKPSIDSTNRRVTTIEEQIVQIELDLKLDVNNRYKVFTYTGDDLTQQLIYEDNTMAVLLFTVDYTYTGDNLTQIDVTRESDSFTYTKVLSYDINDVLQNIDIT